MIHDVDESLRTLIRRDALNGSDVEVSFEAPTKEWAAHQNTPVVDVYLYDIRENLQRRQVIYEDVRDDEGRVVSRRPPPRRFDLSYLVTAWTQRPEDEHRLLSACLACLLRQDVLPTDVLVGSLADGDLPVHLRVALPPAEDRSLSDIWYALGGELKPSLGVVVTAPFATGRAGEAGPPVLEGPLIRTGDDEAHGRAGDAAGRPLSRRPATRSTGKPGRRPATRATARAVQAEETVRGDRRAPDGADGEEQAGRTFGVKQLEAP